MKQFLQLTAIICVLAMGGCATSPQRLVFKSVKTVVESVDAAMNGWRIYVHAERKKQVDNPAGLIALAQNEAKVKSAFESYQKVATAVVVTAVTVSPQGINSPPTTELVAQAVGLQTLISNFSR